MRYARNLHICFVQYFQYNPDWFSVQIYISMPLFPASLQV